MFCPIETTTLRDTIIAYAEQENMKLDGFN